MTQIYIHKDGRKEEKSLISTSAIDILKKECGITDDVDVEIQRLSKWVVEVSLVKGMGLYAKFKFNAKTGDKKRLI